MVDVDVALRDRAGFFDDISQQPECPLYKLPAELRDRIFTLVLTAYEDKDALYNVKTAWSRPSYTAPRRSALGLLRTCKIVYYETWFKPWTLADHSFWLTSRDRRPENALSFERFEQNLAILHKYKGEVEIEQVRFFAQMYMLEDHMPTALNPFLTALHFRPQSITLTIRHTDWWHWEQDEPLRISAKLPQNNVLPDSTRRFNLELETLERKKEQLNSIIDQMQREWSFVLQNGFLLSARHTMPDIERWRGSSTLVGQRWCRDEVEPDTLQYYVATVTFEHEPDFIKPARIAGTLRPAGTAPRLTGLVLDARALTEAAVPDGLSAQQAMEVMHAHQDADPRNLTMNLRTVRRRNRSARWGVAHQ